MSYLVLARKYRPRTFEEVVGQEHVVRALANALDNERLHHAYLFTGTRGVGKTTLARILAACLNCETGVTSAPCGSCGACTAIAEGRFMDLIEVDAASRTGVDDTRELLSNAQFLPGEGRFKVYLIDEVHMLTGHSFNALLKTLEEPPEHVKFLLATTEEKKIPVTVLSRCLQFHLKNMLPDAIEAQLAKVLDAEGVAAQRPALALIAQAALGSMRDALSIADQAISHGGGAIHEASVKDMLGVAGRDEIGALLDALAARDAAALLAAGDALAERSLDLASVLAELLGALRDLAVADGVGAEPPAPLARFQGALAANELQLYYQIALMGSRDMAFAPDPKVGFDMTLLRLACFEPSDGTATTRAETGDDAAPSGNIEGPPTESASVESTASPPARDDRSGAAHDAQRALAGVDPRASEQATERVPDSAQARAASAADDLAWHDIVVAMAPPAGVATMILDNAMLVAREASHWTLRLAEVHQTLLNDKQRAELAELASRFEGRPVELRVETGEPSSETPAQRRKRLEAEAEAKARDVLLADDGVRALLTEFDGRLESARLTP